MPERFSQHSRGQVNGSDKHAVNPSLEARKRHPWRLTVCQSH